MSTEAVSSPAATDEALHRRCQRVLLLGKLLSSLAFFSAFPYLTLYLSGVSTMSKPVAGGVVGSVALVSALGGVLGGRLAERYGAVRLMGLAVLGYAALYFVLAWTRSVPVIVAAIALMSVPRLALEPVVKTLMSASSGAGGNMFRARYVVISAGAIVGPMVGGVLYHAGPLVFFVVPGCVLLGYWLLVLVERANLARLEVPRAEREGQTSVGAAFGDQSLLLVICAGIAVFAVFAQFDSMLPLLMHDVMGGRAVGAYAALLIADACLGIAFQWPVMWLSKRWSRSAVVALGCAGFAGSYLLFMFVSVSPWLLVPGVVLFAVGEAVLIPLPDIMLHEIAPKEVKATYYGLGELRYLGFFLGPVLGGLLLEVGHLPFGVTVSLLAVACFFVIVKVPERGEAS